MDKVEKPWRAVLDIGFHVQSYPHASIVPHTYIQNVNAHEHTYTHTIHTHMKSMEKKRNNNCPSSLELWV